MQEGFQKTTLSNGIRVLSETMPQTRSVSVGIWIQGGSRNDPPSCMGLSHFLEHMVFKGTQSRSAFEIATHLERLGGHINAFTEKEFTCFYATVLDEFLPQAIEILADLVRYSRFDPIDFDTEKQVIFEEIHGLEDTPEELIHEFFLQAVFGDHPLGRPILGTAESLAGITLETMRTFWEAHYTANRVIVSAAGNLDHNSLSTLVEGHFTNMASGDSFMSDPVMVAKKRRRIYSQPITQNHLCVGSVGLSYSNPDKFPLILLNTYLGGGMSSRLFQNIREKHGLAYTIYTFSDTWSDSGLFGVYAGTAEDKMALALEAIESELRAVFAQEIPDSELDRLKSQLRGNLLLAHEAVNSRMGRIAKMEAYTGAYMPLESVLDRIQKVDTQDVLRVAKQVLRPENRYLVAIQPET